MTKVMQHNCVNTQQDKIHGVGQRVFNMTAKEGTWRCTVCSKDAYKGNDPKKKQD